MKIYKTFLLMTALSLSACATHSQQAPASNFKTGLQSFQKQDYKTAFSNLYPAAVEGDSEAQYAVGYMLYYGKAGTVDQAAGINWIRRSAEQGNKLAEQALGIFYAHANLLPDKPL